MLFSRDKADNLREKEDSLKGTSQKANESAINEISK
jgi:hypothetical protein